ncbi:hypothetical protein JCM30471_08620 [Desulfuromonas carbonis]
MLGILLLKLQGWNKFIHHFADGNGRLGRVWQSLILARWNPLFADIPVESLIFEHQAEY